MRDIKSRSKMPLPQTGASYYQAQLGLSDKGRTNKGLIVCYVVTVWVGSMKGMGLCTCARCTCRGPCCGQDGYRAQVPQHPIKI